MKILRKIKRRIKKSKLSINNLREEAKDNLSPSEIRAFHHLIVEGEKK